MRLVMAMRFYQLVGNPDQQEPAGRLQERNIKQERNEGGEDNPQDDRTGAADNDRPPPVLRREAVGGHADDDGIVPGQDQVEGDDLADCYESAESHETGSNL